MGVPAVAPVFYVILRVAGAAGKAGKAVFRIFREGSKLWKEAKNMPGTEEVARSPRREELLKRLPGRSPGALGGKSRGRSPGALGDRLRPEKGTLPPRNKGGVIRSTTKRDSKKPTTRRRKK